MFFAAAEVIRILSPNLVFFENVADITKTKDMKTILMTMRKLGYTVRWTVTSGLDVYAPQMRRRWFCMCAKNDTPLPTLKMKKVKPFWDADAMPDLVQFKDDMKTFAARYFMLGNSIIPMAARLAFVRLYSGFQIVTFEDMMSVKAVSFQHEFSYESPSKGGSGYMVGTKTVKFSIPIPDKRLLTIELDPTHFKITRITDAQSRAVTSNLTRKMFPTPRATIWRNSTALTPRNCRDLSTFALFASTIDDKPTPKTVDGQQVNINLVEWLMGYPKNWTKW